MDSENTSPRLEESVSPPPPIAPNGSNKRFDKLIRFFKRNKKKIAVITPIAIIIIAAIVLWFHYIPANNPNSTTNPSLTTKTPATPVTVADPLTGLQVDASLANQPIVGVMIENLYPDARPQSGLSQAGAVYEALAEGGITRFLAIFQEPITGSIGPVRSLRPYFLRWGLEYNIPVAHAGGSQPALADISRLKMKNIDALGYDGSYFNRVTDRPAPHNLYTTGDKLMALVSKLNFATAPTFTPLPRKADAPLTTPAHTKIDIAYGSRVYNVEYNYTAKYNSYERSQGGSVQIDRNTGKSIRVKNVVVMFTPTSYSTQPDGKPETDINLTGTGKAYIFEDGDFLQATWSKTSDSAQTTFTDATGSKVSFNAGNTWYEVIPTGNTVTY